MRTKIKGIFFVAFLFAGNLFASEILWLNLTPRFSYRDLNTVCSTEGTPFAKNLYFGAEVVGGKVSRAVIQDSMSEILVNRVYFTSAEASSIDLIRDSKGRLWIKSLPMTTRLLDWSFFNAGSEVSTPCRPSQNLRSIAPSTFVFRFDTEGLGSQFMYSDSTRGKFSGTRFDGGVYQTQLLWAQAPFHQ